VTEAASPIPGRGVLRAALVALDGFTALTAIGGGIALAAGVEGDRFPVELLAGTPFSSYVAPGLILAVVVGGSAAAATAATLRSLRRGARVSTLAGGILMGWIVGEVAILQAPEARSLVEAMYSGIGLLMVGLGIVGWRLERPRRLPDDRIGV